MYSYGFILSCRMVAVPRSAVQDSISQQIEQLPHGQKLKHLA
jgi:hypothetical protein